MLSRRYAQRLCVKTISTYQSLVYEKYGKPLDVLSMVERPSEPLDSNAARVRWLAAPINPADLNQVSGVYPVKPALPAVGGNEGVGEVIEVGGRVGRVKVGDWVLPYGGGHGTWRTESVAAERDLIVVPNSLPLKAAATLLVNPPTAYRLLHDYCSLTAGDTIVQNGANSAVGRCVIQLARLMRVRTVNVVRARADLAELSAELRALGADDVIADDEAPAAMRRLSGDGRAPVLALNCVGGKSSLMLASALGVAGKMVTYGGMSRQPVHTPTAAFIFRQIELHGFWMTHWYGQPGNGDAARSMLDYLIDLIQDGQLQPPPINELPFVEWKRSVELASASGSSKQLMVHSQSK